MTVDQKIFIETIGKAAQKDMQESGILASLTTAQAILESSWGASKLSTAAKALFGIKATNWTGKVYNAKTWEVYNGKTQSIIAGFRAYDSWSDSIKDHSKLLTSAPRYHKLIGEKDYHLACRYIKDAGYATDPDYTTKLVSLISNYKLYTYDKVDEKVDIKNIKIKNLENDYAFTVKGVMIDGTNYVSARELMETFGFKVGWDDKTKTVTVNK